MVSFQVQQGTSHVGLRDSLSNPHCQISSWRTPLGSVSIIHRRKYSFSSVSLAQIVIMFCFAMKRRGLPIIGLRNNIVNTIKLSFDRVNKKNQVFNRTVQRK